MSTPRKNNHLKNLNRYSWSILISFVFATFSMLYKTAHISLESLFQTLPLIIVAIYYCEKLAPLISQPELNLNKSELFTRDSFILTLRHSQLFMVSPRVQIEEVDCQFSC